jgi:hypothetical protein
MRPRHIDDFAITELDRPALDYVWQHMRRRDREEVLLQGLTNDNYAAMILANSEKFSTSLDGVPLAVFGAIETKGCFWIFFMATDALRRHLRLFTDCAIGFIEYLRRKYFGKRCLVNVWQEHTQSVRWLASLGFAEVERIAYSEQPFLIMEKR